MKTVKTIIYPKTKSDEINAHINENVERACKKGKTACSAEITEFIRLENTEDRFTNLQIFAFVSLFLVPVFTLLQWVFIVSLKIPQTRGFEFVWDDSLTPYTIVSAICFVLAIIIFGALFKIFEYKLDKIRSAQYRCYEKIENELRNILKADPSLMLNMHSWCWPLYDRLEDKIENNFKWFNSLSDNAIYDYVEALKRVESLANMKNVTLAVTGVDDGFINICTIVNGFEMERFDIQYKIYQTDKEDAYKRVNRITEKLDRDGVLDLSFLDECVKPYLEYVV